MKKVLAMVGVMLFSASAFAINAEVPAGKDCQGQRAAFEKNVASQENEAFIAQNILINLADPLARMSDEEALPLAQCYATYRVKGQTLVAFVNAHADIFPGDVSGKEAKNMRNFAGRVAALSEKAAFDEMAQQKNDYFIAQNILINLADPFAKLPDAEAAPKAKVYARFEVKGEPMLQFVSRLASQHDELEGLHDFAHRVSALAK